MYNIPHGLANAVLIPYVLEAYGDKIYKQLKDLAISAGLAKENTPEEQAAKSFINSIKILNKSLNIGTKLPELQIKDIKALAENASKEANPIYPVPVLMDENELQQLYYALLDKDNLEEDLAQIQKGELVHA